MILQLSFLSARCQLAGEQSSIIRNLRLKVLLLSILGVSCL